MSEHSLVWHTKHLTFPIFGVKPKLTLLRRTCRQAAALLIAREDRVLSLPDHVALKLHLLACEACPNFENQILTLRAAMGKWRHYSSETEAAITSAPPDRPAE
jgi:hypothetical protein